MRESRDLALYKLTRDGDVGLGVFFVTYSSELDSRYAADKRELKDTVLGRADRGPEILSVFVECC